MSLVKCALRFLCRGLCRSSCGSAREPTYAQPCLLKATYSRTTSVFPRALYLPAYLTIDGFLMMSMPTPLSFFLLVLVMRHRDAGVTPVTW